MGDQQHHTKPQVHGSDQEVTLIIGVARLVDSGNEPG
jgi:hypothetical protein